MFPEDDVKTWNAGIWPPNAFKYRWRELMSLALTGAAGCDGTPEAIVSRAESIADWALRVELERTNRELMKP